MGVLKRRRESEPIAFKAPVGLKREIDYLRGRSEAAGFDLAKTITAEGGGGCANRSRPNSGRCLLQTAGSSAA